MLVWVTIARMVFLVMGVGDYCGDGEIVMVVLIMTATHVYLVSASATPNKVAYY